MIVIFSVRLLLLGGKGRWEEGRAGEKKNCFGSNRVCHQPGCARQMDHEYCLDALCLSGAVVSKDKQWDAGLSDWGKSGRAPLPAIAIRAALPAGAASRSMASPAPTWPFRAVGGKGEGCSYRSIDFSRICPGTAGCFSWDYGSREGADGDSHHLAIKHML